MKSIAYRGLLAAGFAVVFIGGAASLQAQPYTEFALTAANAGYSAACPAWSPSGETIVYSRYSNSDYYTRNLYSVQGDATTVSETTLATTNAMSGDMPNGLAWLGDSPIMSERQGLNYEYFSFAIPASPPVARTVGDGNQAGFTMKLKGDWKIHSLWGVDHEYGDMIKISRDGITALVRYSSFAADDAPTYTRTTSLYTGPVSTLTGLFMVTGSGTHWID